MEDGERCSVERRKIFAMMGGMYNEARVHQ